MKAVAIVPAAGAGRRLGGVCKALLRRPDGRTFLDAVVAGAREAGCAEVIVVVAEPFGRDVEAALPAGARAVWNPAPERGMASSIACGLAAAGPAEAALLWPVDHPNARVASARAVLAAAGPAGIAVPAFEGRGGHPAAFGREIWPELLACSNARDVVRRDPARVRRVVVDDPGVVRDVDRPEDLG